MYTLGISIMNMLWYIPFMWEVILTLKWIKDHDVQSFASKYHVENIVFMYLNELYELQNVSLMNTIWLYIMNMKNKPLFIVQSPKAT